MIDVKKSRNNFQKFPSLKQKCDPDIIVKKQQININTTTIPNASTKPTAAALRHKSPVAVTAEAKSQYSSKAATAVVKTPSNPVREANQHFFLISAYKDQNFLKEECELAHAQVIRPPKKDSKHSKKPTLLPTVIDHRRTVSSCPKVFSSNNNPVSIRAYSTFQTTETHSHRFESLEIFRERKIKSKNIRGSIPLVHS